MLPRDNETEVRVSARFENGECTMSRNRKLGLLICGILSAAPSVAEQRPGAYVGASGGSSRYALSQDDFYRFDNALGLPRISAYTPPGIEDDDTGFSLFGGYRFSRNLAVEIAYVDLGKAELNATGRLLPLQPGFLLTVTNSIEIDTSGVSAAVVGSLPLGETFDIHGRLGLLFARTKYDLSTTFVVAPPANSKSSQPALFGAGAAAHLGAHWSVGLDWTRFTSVGANDAEFDVDLLSASAAYRF
jgi:OmpA-OmpF porin, OOP family